jgi:hypothetical protein
MIRLIFSISAIFVCLNLYGQQRCDSLSLSQADKTLLLNFWTEFKEALNNKDKVKLATLCRFPFTCDYCVLDSTKVNDKPYIKVTKEIFDSSQYGIFFKESLIKEVNIRDMPQDLFIFQPYYNTIEKKCSFYFSYIALEENEQHPGMQHFFDIQNVKGQFKIIGTWTIP